MSRNTLGCFRVHHISCAGAPSVGMSRNTLGWRVNFVRIRLTSWYTLHLISVELYYSDHRLGTIVEARVSESNEVQTINFAVKGIGSCR